MKRIILFLFTTLLIFQSYCQDKAVSSYEQIMNSAESIQQNFINGVVDWSQQYVEATGESVVDTVRFKNKAQARAMATRGAVVIAQRNLLEIINGVQVTSGTTVENMITANDVIYTKVDGVIRGAQMIGKPVEEFGMITVIMRVSLYREGGLADAVIDGLPPDVTEEEITKEQQEEKTTTEEIISNDEVNEEIFAFNLNGKLYDPSLFPVIVDESGEILVDFKKIYDPAKGVFPRVLKQSGNILKDLGVEKGVKIIDVIEAKSGQLVVSTKMN